ncbi:MAG: hypothetical protein LBD99_05550 [Candidatus Margulisbacteria bacterium]|jgi:hypothetical protein|nr:hypothetical protein [Candidatus Margulisiibacteriota bacterium]
MDDFFAEEFIDPENSGAEQDEFLRKYYDDIFSALISGPGAYAGAGAELQPYEVIVFSEDPGVLRRK